MFVQSTSKVERPYLRLRRALIGDSDWLAPLARQVLYETFEHTAATPTAADCDNALTQLRSAFRCEIGRIRLHADTITVPMQWLNGIEPGLFPPVLDADLRLTSIGATHSQVAIDGTYPRTQPPADPAGIHQTVQTVIDAYLRDVTAILYDQTK